MIVTKKKYEMNDFYLKKLNIMIKRMKKTDDAIVIVDGDEGQGKTEFAFGTCYYIAEKLNRKYTVDNVFFDLDSMIQFASSTKEQIIHFDEAALGLLRTQWQSKMQQKFLQLVMVARKKKHFIILCIPKFHRLPPYVIEDRSIALVHVYSHQNIHKGRFCYYTKKSKEALFNDYQKKKVKSYKKHYSFRGKFIEASKVIFTDGQVEEYEKKKDEAILSVGSDDNMMNKRQARAMRQRDILIKYLKKKEGLKGRNLVNKLNEIGVDLSRSVVQEIIQKPTPLTATPL